jgi:hypothetical protein
VSYRVKQLQPPVLEPIGLPTGISTLIQAHLDLSLTEAGDKCGAIYVDLAFKEWLKNLLGVQSYRLIHPHVDHEKVGSHSVEGKLMRALMNRFDSFKKQFCRDHGDVRLDLPEPLHTLSLKNSFGEVENGQVTIPK